MINYKLLSKKFLKDGYIKLDLKIKKFYLKFRKLYHKISKKKLNKKSVIKILNNFHNTRLIKFK